MKPQTFEEFLKEWHADTYHSTDDDMPDAFDHWLGDLGADAWLTLGDTYGEKRFNEGAVIGSGHN